VNRYAKVAFAVAALVWGATNDVRAAPVNLIVDGSFEAPNVGTGWNLFPNGAVPGWTSNNNQTEIDYTPILSLPFYDGCCQSMEADGSTYDTISQAVSGLSVGRKYTLSWGYGDRPGSGPQQLNVSFGGVAVTTDYGSGSGVWTGNSFVVTATATSEVLSFAAINVGGNPSVGNEVDDVSLVGVPEPASMAVLASGLLGLGLLRRLRR
jgi:hypothetical protein